MSDKPAIEMASCELCGSEESSLTKIKTEGTKLEVCEDCSSVGKDISTPSKSRQTSSSSASTSSSRDSGKALARDYGDRIKDAREAADMEQSELADRVSEKESRISKIEREKLKPDQSLGKKLSKELEIDLYVTPEVDNYGDTGGSDSRSATLGDVAEVSED